MASERRHLLKRLVQSRKLRWFFAISLILHGLFFGLLVVSEDFRHMVFGSPDRQVEEVDASEQAVRRAVATLLEVYTEKFAASVREMEQIRAELDQIQREKLARLRTADAERKQLIEAGLWPTAEQPDPTAKFVARADVDPPSIQLTDLPPLPESPYPDELEALRDQVVELYRLHAPLERDAGNLFERYHALELAEYPEEPIPLSRSLENTRLEMPERPDLDLEHLDPHIRSAIDGRLKAFRQELADAWLNSQDMLNTTRHWLERARSSELQLAGMFGEQYDIVPPPEPYYGHYLNPKLLKPVTLQRMINPPVALARSIGGEQGLLKSDWIALNRWYVIGPFHHPGGSRRMEDLERKFGPEATIATGVDLGAVYEGKGNRMLRWKYRHVGPDFLEGGKRIEPFSVDNTDYGVWYFYTELHSDEAMTVLGSFGSDDYGVCWVNGKRVYQSPPTQRPWQIFTPDSFRPVPLKKGINQVLFKLENASGSTGFSVILMTYEDAQLLQAIEQMN